MSMDGPHSQNRYCAETINILSLLGTKPQFLGCAAHSLVNLCCSAHSLVTLCCSAHSLVNLLSQGVRRRRSHSVLRFEHKHMRAVLLDCNVWCLECDEIIKVALFLMHENENESSL